MVRAGGGPLVKGIGKSSQFFPRQTAKANWFGFQQIFVCFKITASDVDLSDAAVRQRPKNQGAKMTISRLAQLDGPRTGTAGGRPLRLHNDHRWTVPLIAQAQEDGLVPRPCHLIMFDRHHDALTPDCVTELQKIRSKGSSVPDLVNLCESHLRPLDDDWIKAAMELGLVDYAVVFGVEDKPPANEVDFDDHRGQRHRIIVLGPVRTALQQEGDLSDLARCEELRELWRILGWRQEEDTFTFATGDPKSFLTVDLGCFVVSWREYLFPWPEEVYANEFLSPSTFWSTKGWTAKGFFHGLLDNAGVLDIARDPWFCGGDEKADRILADLKQHVFDGMLRVE